MSDKLNVLKSDEPWYKDGLRFECTQCGQCCTGGPGFVWVSNEEIEEMAAFLEITVQDFSRRYLRRVMGRLSLVERSNYDCVFLKDRKCQLYHARPKQCRTFPWWPQNLSSPEAWAEAAQQCEGIRPDAPLISLEVIERNLKSKTS